MSDLKPVKDRYGILRELKDDYEFDSVLPGAVTIPSHKDNKGGQLGREKRPPIPMVIDPDINGDRPVVITPAMLDANPQLLSSGGEASGIYKSIQTAGSGKSAASGSNTETTERRPLVPRRKRGTPAAKKAAGKKTSRVSTDSTKASAEAEPSNDDRAVDAADTRGQDLDDMALSVNKLIEVVQQQSSTVSDVIERVNELTSAVDDIQAPATADAARDPEPEHSPQPLPAQEPVPDPGPAPAAAPKISVTFQFPGSQMAISSRYHTALRDGNNLVTVFDTDFEYGDRVQLAANMEAPYVITVHGEDGMQSLQSKAMYFGQRFTHGNYEYTLFILSGGEDGSS